MRISDWSSDVCSSDLILAMDVDERHHHLPGRSSSAIAKYADALRKISLARRSSFTSRSSNLRRSRSSAASAAGPARRLASSRHHRRSVSSERSVEHTSELQSLMRISYAVFCLKKKTTLKT